MDHLNQIPGVGPLDNWMLEGNTALAALAAGGVTYRRRDVGARDPAAD
jgi:hypothetical protein